MNEILHSDALGPKVTTRQLLAGANEAITKTLTEELTELVKTSKITSPDRLTWNRVCFHEIRFRHVKLLHTDE